MRKRASLAASWLGCVVPMVVPAHVPALGRLCVDYLIPTSWLAL
jgi:hypothetical protein